MNAYACALEDMLVEQAQKTDEVVELAASMEEILTDPDHLADYTDRYFTEVVPVDIEDAFDDDDQYDPNAAYQQQYDMPAPPVGAAGQSAPNGQTWEQFGEVMSRSPENAWRVLSSMQPEALRSKLLFMEPS